MASIPLVLASRNRGKLDEFARLLGPGWELVPLPPEAPEPVEDGPTYAANALIKARSAAGFCLLPALADDSGLEIDVCGGHPGLRSARWTSGDVNGQLLERLRGVPAERRTARMRAVVAVALPDGRSATAEGVVEGAIAETPRGTGGFGYDPIFLLPDGRSLAELEGPAKDQLSHRGRAVRSLLPYLGALGLGPVPRRMMRGDGR